MGCIQGLRIRKILVGERACPVDDEPPVVLIDEIMPTKSKSQTNDCKYNKESEECSEENDRDQKKRDNVNRGRKGKQNGFKGGITTDAIPTPKRNAKQKKSFSSSLSSSTYEMHDMKDDQYSDQDELDKKYSIPTPEIQVDEPKDDDFERDRNSCSNSSKYDDEGDVVSEMDEDEGKNKRSKKKNKLALKDFFSRKTKASPEAERYFPAYAPHSPHQYHISHSKNIHIGPTYEQKIIVNNVTRGPRRDEIPTRDKSPVQETEAIRAIKQCDSPLTVDVLNYVAKEIGHCWREMGRKFGYTDGRLDSFEIDHRIHSETVYHLLLDWYQDKTEEATFATLSQTLWTIEERQAVERLADYFLRQSP